MKIIFCNVRNCRFVHAVFRHPFSIWWRQAASKEAVIVKQVKVGGGPVCLSENTPLVFYDRSMDIIEVIFTSGTESKTGLLVISGNYGQVTEQFDLFNGKASFRSPNWNRDFTRSNCR